MPKVSFSPLSHMVAGIVCPVLLAGCASRPATSPSVSSVDRSQKGTSFEEVVRVLRADPYDLGDLPLARTTIDDIRSEQMLRDAGRTLDASADIREPFRRILHPNGVCLAGEWIVDKPNPYSGVYKQGSRFPIVARISPPNDGVITRPYHPQSVGLVGKIFPARDTNESVTTANFFTQTDLGGYIGSKATVLDPSVVMVNAPGVTAINRGLEVAAFAIQGNVLDRVDLMTTQRPLYQLSEAHRSGEATHTPKFMKLSLNPAMAMPGTAHGDDMRLEFWRFLSEHRPLVYDVWVSNSGRVVGPNALQRSFIDWDKEPIGRIEFSEAFLSSGCDHRIHFQHAAWRENPDDPATTVRAQHGVAFGQPLIRDQVALNGQVISRQKIGAVFKELNDIEKWPSWSSNSLVAQVTKAGADPDYDISFSVGGETMPSYCRHEAEVPSAISLSCRASRDALQFLKDPIEHEVTFLLSELPNGKTRIAWGMVLHSPKAVSSREEVQSKVQKALEQHFPEE